MGDFTLIQQFHFLRPWWLLLLLPAGVLAWTAYQRSDSLRAWKRLIDPALLKHLTVSDDGKQSSWRPIYLLAIAWLTGIIALAGPSWQMQTSPFSEDLAAMYIVMKVTPQMQAQDIQPSRLQRSIIKVHDLLEIKNDIRAGLIAYAGSAHLVMPLTSDSGVINNFAAALEPGIMPLEGDEPAEAIAMATQRLMQADAPGSIVLVTDGIDRSHLEALRQVKKTLSFDVHILAIAAGPEVIPPAGSFPAPALDIDTLNEAAGVLGGTVTVVSADKSDVENIASKVERSISSAPAKEGQQWKDQGYYLLFLFALIMLPLFRKGGSVSIE